MAVPSVASLATDLASSNTASAVAVGVLNADNRAEATQVAILFASIGLGANFSAFA